MRRSRANSLHDNKKSGTLLESNCDNGDVSMNCKCRRLSCLSILLGLASIFFLRNVSLVLEMGHGDHGRQLSALLEQQLQQLPVKNDHLPKRSENWQRYERQKTKKGIRKKAKKKGRSEEKKRKIRTRSIEASDDHIEPRAEALAPNATFAACLLIKDDNDILPEWLAYHYHTINLRDLIVAVDPTSNESPSIILQNWRRLSDLRIREWTDSSYMPAAFLKTGTTPEDEIHVSDIATNVSEAAIMAIANHRYRQRVFLTECMRTFRQAGISWVIHIDTDEFVVASKLLRQMNPDYVELPELDQPGSLLRFIQHVVQITGDLVNYPCITMLRILFGSQESKVEAQQAEVPKEFNGTAFETMRWRHHGLPHNKTIHGMPKVILDVGAIPKKYFEQEKPVFSIHRPIREFCPKIDDLAFGKFRRQPIAVNHYLGSWERYSGRNDNRRSRDVYNAKAGVNTGHDDGLRPWLRGFIQSMGFSVASNLLGDTYLSKNVPKDDTLVGDSGPEISSRDIDSEAESADGEVSNIQEDPKLSSSEDDNKEATDSRELVENAVIATVDVQ